MSDFVMNVCVRTGRKGFFCFKYSIYSSGSKWPLGFGAQESVLFPLVLFPHRVDRSLISSDWNMESMMRVVMVTLHFLNEYFRFVEIYGCLTSGEAWQVSETQGRCFLFWKVFAPHDGHKLGLSEILFS